MKFLSLVFAVLFSLSSFGANPLIMDSRKALDVALNNFTTAHTEAVDLFSAYKVWHWGPRFGVKIYLMDGKKMEYDCGKKDGLVENPMTCDLLP